MAMFAEDCQALHGPRGHTRRPQLSEITLGRISISNDGTGEHLPPVIKNTDHIAILDVASFGIPGVDGYRFTARYIVDIS